MGGHRASGSNLGPSQTTEGDAWSGVKRTPATIVMPVNTTSRARSASNLSRTDKNSNGAEEGDDRVNARNAASVLAGGF